ncbi:MAG TPA: hypothetical protein VG458_04495, partial [Solirubrobacterales bacterium]|nr:hypothetical protein [Solirubrobacterales bacterium]
MTDAQSPPELFEDFLFGLAVVRAGDGGVLSLNRRARAMLLPASTASGGAGLHCCELICSRLEPIIGGGCMTEWVAKSATQLPEVRMDIQT